MGGPGGGKRLPQQVNPEDETEPVSSMQEAGRKRHVRGQDAQDGVRVRKGSGLTPKCPSLSSWAKGSVATPWAAGRVAAWAPPVWSPWRLSPGLSSWPKRLPFVFPALLLNCSMAL